VKMNDVLNLPKSWVQATISDLGKVVSGGTPSTKENSYWGGNISWISPSDLTGYRNKHIDKGAKSITLDGLKNSSATIMPAGSIHFSSRAPIGYTVISATDMTTNQGFKSLAPAQGIFNEYIYYYFKSAKQLAESKATGTTFKEISGTAFSKLPVPLPPTSEQHRIVTKIEELFSELDKGIEALKTARAQLKVYRQALLKHAFEGKLTAQWRAENPAKLETADALLKRIQQARAQRYQQQLAEWANQSPSVPLLQRGKPTSAATSSPLSSSLAHPPLKKGGRGDLKPKAPKPLPPLTKEELAELPELPEGWGWVKLGDLASKITDGEHFKPPVKAEGVYFLSAKDVKHDGVSFDDPLFIDEETAKKARLRCDPERNDILIVSRGATVGRKCIVNTDERFCLLGSVILVKAIAAVQSRYFLSALKSPLVNKRIVGVSGATAQQAIYLRDIQHVPVPVCSSLEQLKIVEELESKLSEVDQLELTIIISLQQAEALRQSILKRAFAGLLVPQDPHDEPASKLLARIKAERATVVKSATVRQKGKRG